MEIGMFAIAVGRSLRRSGRELFVCSLVSGLGILLLTIAFGHLGDDPWRSTISILIVGFLFGPIVWAMYRLFRFLFVPRRHSY